jgi:glycosyltransferase involved in cell wall biosynthesis
VHVVQVVCSDGFAGVERYIASLAAGLAAEGVEVSVVGGAERQMTEALGPTAVAWRPGNTMVQALRELRALPRPDVVNSHMSQADLVVALGRAGRRFRHVSTRHFGAVRGRSRAAAAVFAAVGRRIDAQLAISSFVAQNVEGDSEVVHSGVESRPDGGSRAPEVLLVQRLEAEKDGETAVRAWATSTARAQGWRLRVVGDGSQRALLESLAAELGVGDSIEFMGFRNDVDELLSRASVVLAPTPREGLGIAVLEAMAHGVPVVAAADGGHLETVGIAAPDLLFRPGDAAAAARLLDGLVADPDRRDVAGRALRDLQRERFTLASQVAATRQLYAKVLAR